MVPFWKSIIVLAALDVSQPEKDQVNHMLRVLSFGTKRFLVSYTGPSSLGNEGDSVKVELTNVECEEGFGVKEHPTLGPKGYQAWICNAEGAKLLP